MSVYQNPIRIFADGLGSILNGAEVWSEYRNTGDVATLRIPVGTSTPDPRPNGPFVRFLLIGGYGQYVETYLLEVEAWAPDQEVAWDTLVEVRSAVEALAHSGPIRRTAKDSNPYESPTGESGWERFAMSFGIDLNTRGPR